MDPSRLCLLLVCLVLQFASLHITNAAPVSKMEDTSTYDEIENINKKTNGKFFEGDIALSPLVDEVVNGAFNGAKRDATRFRHYLWRTRVIPYVIAPEFDTTEQTQIRNAMNMYEQNTCLRFKQYSNETNWINFKKLSGCYSTVGRMYWSTGAQVISLGKGCMTQKTILHEVMHAIGFWHEQSRPDRDNFVEIFWENIYDGESHNFAKYSHLQADVLGTQYDYDTVMHYGKFAFSKNGKQTLKAIGSDRALGSSTTLGASDIVAINALYDCASKDKSIWSTWSSYGPCDSRCFKTRQRFCSHPDLTECPTANNYGVAEEQVICSDAECNAPVDGHWGRWSSWSACNAECGPGKRNRTRSCDNPLPKNGGNVCAGESKSFADCNVKRCGMGPLDCEFDGQGWCFWQNDPTNPSTFKWQRISGPTPSGSTGPNSDHTSGAGSYLFVETSSPAATGDKARIISKEMPATEGLCMSFWYHMYGMTMGSLRIFTQNTNGVKSMIWEQKGDLGNQWLKGDMKITSQTPFKVVFEAEKGSAFLSDIGLDDIFFKDCAPKSALEHMCGVKMEALGCFNKNDNDPVLPILLDNHRDPNHGHVGFTINWSNYPQSMQDILCHCAQRSKGRGYKYFGLSFYAECWAGPGEINYNKHGISDRCVNTKYEKCLFSKYAMCCGTDGNNFVYKL